MDTEFRNPFDVEPSQANLEERMLALYGILQSHQTADKAGCELKLAPGVKRAFGMADWDCKTAACAAGSAGLVPWFQEVAKSQGVPFTIKMSGAISPPDYLSTSDIWENANMDMRGLFMGYQEIYAGIADHDGTDRGRMATLRALTPFQVKQALRRIIIKHFGADGARRCDEMDQHCNILAE